MNQKKARMARREARRRTVGQPECEYVRDSRTRVIRVHPTSTRGMYKSIKKMIKGKVK